MGVAVGEFGVAVVLDRGGGWGLVCGGARTYTLMRVHGDKALDTKCGEPRIAGGFASEIARRGHLERRGRRD